MPIDIRLTATPAPAGVPLAAHLAAPVGAADDGADIAVAVQGAETAGLDAYLGGPAADVLAACDATGKAGEVTAVPARIGDQPWRLLFVGLGDGSAPDLRKAGAALGRRATADRAMLVMALESPVADLANVRHASRPRAGSIEAALFLREFTGGRPWAHLDIAGAARSSPDGDEAKGATGFGTRLLLRWLSGPGAPPGVVPRANTLSA